MSAITRITIDVEIQPDVDASTFQIAAAVVLGALHDAGLYPDQFTVETVENGS